MQVAMRLGPSWWRRLGEKHIYGACVRRHTYSALFLLAVTPVGLVAANYLKEIATTPPLVGSVILSLTLAIGALLCMFLTLMSGVFGFLLSVCIGGVFVRSLIATLRFRTSFGFSPPVTIEGRGAVELAIKKILAIRAHTLNEIYEREKRTLKGIESYECDSARCNDNDALQKIGKNVASIEYYDLGEVEKVKKQAKKGFYPARDAARNPFLPVPFKKLPDSYKEYLNYLPKREK